MVHFSTKQKVWLISGIVSLLSFVVLTLVVTFVDVNQVGLSHLNQFFWQHCGKNETWERITNWLGYLTIMAVFGVIVWQIVQWVCRKSPRKIDKNLLIFDVIMACWILVYVFFEIVIINYRPMLDNGVAKASYPSSHAMLFAMVLPLLIWQVWHYIKNKPLSILFTIVLSVMLVIGIVGRLVSGVHWFTDIVAGVVISFCLVCVYNAFAESE